MKKVKLPVKGMTCAHCSKTVEDVLQKAGIGSHVNLSQGTVTFSYDEEKVSLVYLQRLIKKAGYDLVLPSDKKKIPWMSIRFYSAIVVLVVSLCGMLHHLGLKNDFTMFFDNPILRLVVASFSLIILGVPFNIRAIKNLKNKSLGMDMLVSLSTIIAFALSLYTFIAQRNETYFESTSMILSIITIGDRITAKLKSSTGTSSLEALKNDGTKVMKMTKKGGLKYIDIDEVEPGDNLVVKRGEMIGADGILVKGLATIDEKILTGESRPRHANIGEHVYYGTSNLGDEIVIEVEKPAIESLYTGVILESYALDRSHGHLNKISDFIASIFVPVIFVIAIVGFFVSFYALGKDIEHSVISAVSILVVSCPCAFGLAVPLASLNGYNKAIKRGIMFKNGSTFEKIKHVNEFYFDKTGTLTTGKMKVIYAAFEDDMCKRIVKGMEMHSIHPIAEGIVSYLSKNQPMHFENVEEVAGGGLVCDQYKIGNYEFVSSPTLYGQYTAANDYEGTKVYFTADGELMGVMVLEDEIAPGAFELIKMLKKRNIKTYMLTGDNKEFALKMGRTLGLKDEEIFYELLPDDKIKVIKENSSKNSVTAYCGDGINDLAALAMVDLSIASYRASSATSASSDVVLLKDDLHLISEVIDLSRHVYFNIIENFIWALVYNAVMIPLAMIGRLEPTLSAVLMIASNITLILNSWRISLWKGGKREKDNS